MSSKPVQVFNLATGEERMYWCAPFTAVICAYAQFVCKDYNTWQYQKYHNMVEVTKRTYLLGDWSALHGQG